jgi:hypothetical protein
MDVNNRPTQDFQQWLESLDEAEVRAEDEAIERELESLQRRRELLGHALDLKHEWRALFPPNAQTPVFENGQSPDSENGQSPVFENGQSQVYENGQSRVYENGQSQVYENGQSPVFGNDQSPVVENERPPITSVPVSESQPAESELTARVLRAGGFQLAASSLAARLGR